MLKQLKELTEQARLHWTDEEFWFYKRQLEKYVSLSFKTKLCDY